MTINNVKQGRATECDQCNRTFHWYPVLMQHPTFRWEQLEFCSERCATQWREVNDGDEG